MFLLLSIFTHNYVIPIRAYFILLSVDKIVPRVEYKIPSRQRLKSLRLAKL